MITSLQNPLVKKITTLQDARDRKQQGLFLIEGETELLHALTAGIVLDTLAYCPDLIPDNQQLTSLPNIKQLLSDSVTLEPVSPRVYAKIAYRRKVQGLLAVARTPQLSLDKIKLPSCPCILIIQAVEKPGNLGALLRTADGVNDRGVDLYNPNVVRASLGALFTVPVLASSSQQTRQWLQQHHIKTVLTTPSASQTYTDLDYTGPVALVLGSESVGLDHHWLQDKENSCHVKIPMRGRMDSLNVSCSGAVILYEIMRQRTARK